MRRFALPAVAALTIALVITAFFLVVFTDVFAAKNKIPNPARTAFDEAAEFDMYSLDPVHLEGKDAGVDKFHHWKILGKMTVKGDDVKTVRNAVEKGVKESDGSVAACFNPRHGIRIVHEKKIYDLVICYECSSASVFDGDQMIGKFLTSRSPEKTLTKILSDANVPLPKTAE